MSILPTALHFEIMSCSWFSLETHTLVLLKKKKSRGAFTGTRVLLFGATEIVFTGLNKPNWQGKRCRAGAGWANTLVGDRVIPRARVEAYQTLLPAAVKLQDWIDTQGDAKRRRDGKAVQSAPISLSLSIPFVTCHGLALTDPLSCPEHVIHSDVHIPAD